MMDLPNAEKEQSAAFIVSSVSTSRSTLSFAVSVHFSRGYHEGTCLISTTKHRRSRMLKGVWRVVENPIAYVVLCGDVAIEVFLCLAVNGRAHFRFRYI